MPTIPVGLGPLEMAAARRQVTLFSPPHERTTWRSFVRKRPTWGQLEIGSQPAQLEIGSAAE